jgi:hypothetical protein
MYSIADWVRCSAWGHCVCSQASSLSMPGYTMRGLGFQVVCGSLTWTPFVFSLQCRYLSDHPSAANAVPNPTARPRCPAA